MAKDIVRVLQDIAEAESCIYHYGKKAALNILEAPENTTSIYLLHEFTNRKSQYNGTGTKITGHLYEGKMFLVKHSDFDQQYFQERGNESTSKYTTNIEPLLEVFDKIGNILGCSNLEVMQWDNIDITDALDANMDGLLITYKIKVPYNYE